MKKSKFKLIIFDFDGTIADSFGLCFESINNILKENGREGITLKEKKEARKLSARKVFRYFKISKYQLPFVVRKIFNEMEKNFSKVKMFPGLKMILKELGNSDIKIILLTSNIRKNVDNFVINKKIKSYFNNIYYKSSIFGKHLIIKKIIKKYKIRKNEILLIGDEVRDIKAAKKSGIKVAAVSWGYNFEEILLENKPDFFLKKPLEIFKIIDLKRIDLE